LLRRGVTLSALAAVSLPPSRANAALVAVLRTPAPAVQVLAKATIRSLALAATLKTAAAMLLVSVLVTGLGFATLQVQDDSKKPPVLTAGPKDDAFPLLIDRDGGPVPAEALARIGSTRFRQGGDVTGLAYSPDGTWLASISTSRTDSTARLWDAATGKEKLRVEIKTSGATNLLMNLTT